MSRCLFDVGRPRPDPEHSHTEQALHPIRIRANRAHAQFAAGGLALGVIGAYFLGRAMQSTLLSVGAINLPVLLGVGAVLLASALLACYVPARRASAIEPMVALREE